MRIIVYGVGAIGGVIAASLVLAGTEVLGIARGRMLEAIRAHGLVLKTPLVSERVTLPCVGSPSEVDFRADDVIMLTMKSQDTHAALEALRDAGVRDQAIVCAQNGIDNERMALRLFPNVYAMTVMCPGTYTVPGEVLCHSRLKRGMFDLGRYPSGTDDTVRALAAALNAAEFKVDEMADVMRSKHGKLIENQANVVHAALGSAPYVEDLVAGLKAEGEAVYRAAGIDWMEIGGNDPRRHGVMAMGEIEGSSRGGDSSTQSLARGTGSIETDYLNGEIVLLGRLHGVPTPLNAAMVTLGHLMVAEKRQPGSVTTDEIKALVGQG